MAIKSSLVAIVSIGLQTALIYHVNINSEVIDHPQLPETIPSILYGKGRIGLRSYSTLHIVYYIRLNSERIITIHDKVKQKKLPIFQ